MLSKSLASLLCNGVTSIQSVHSHNVLEDENIGTKQLGRTATILHDQLEGKVINSGRDYTGLGRWSWYRIQGKPGCRSRVVTAYALCGNNNSGYESYY